MKTRHTKLNHSANTNSLKSLNVLTDSYREAVRNLKLALTGIKDEHLRENIKSYVDQVEVAGSLLYSEIKRVSFKVDRF